MKFKAVLVPKIRVKIQTPYNLNQNRKPLIKKARNKAMVNQTAFKVEVLQIASGLETTALMTYYGLFLTLLAAVGYVIFRQIFIRYRLNEAVKELGDRVRKKDVSAKDYFELGAVLLRMKLYSQALRNLEKSIKNWDGWEVEQAQVYNALGFTYMELNRLDKALDAYLRAVKLQPGYTTCWNNMGNIYELKNDFEKAISWYKETLTYDKENVVATQQIKRCEAKVKLWKTPK
jgi:tetratricopeptide (TPR) repeat protein